MTGFSLIVTHVFASLILISPGYYPKLFDGTKLNLSGELSLLMGLVSLWCFVMPAVATVPFMYEELGADRWLRSQRVGYLGLAIAALHVGIMGFKGWLTPGEWPGYMPPITIVSFLIALIPLVVRLKSRSQQNIGP